MSNVQDTWGELSGRVRAFVGRRINDPHSADDITQDVMLKVQTHMESLQTEEKLPAWILAVARNAIVDHHRSSALRKHGNQVDFDLVEEPADADQQSVLADLQTCLLRMVDQLPEPYREAMVLADLDGLTQQAIADRMGISLSGAKSRVQRARQQLRQMMHDCCRIETDRHGNVVEMQTTERSAGYCPGADGGPACTA